MSSTYTLYPSSVPDTTAIRRDRVDEPRFLQQYISPQAPSTSPSPSLNVNTPADSESTLSVNYQSSEFSEGDDPFFGANFNAVGGASPSFLDEGFFSSGNAELANALSPQAVALPDTQHVPQGSAYLPLSPDRTPSLPTASPNSGATESRATFPNLADASIAPQEFASSHGQTSFVSESSQASLRMTPRTSNSEQSSDNSLAPAAPNMQSQSPRVTVSRWEDGQDYHSFELNTGEQPAENPVTAAITRDDTGRWVPDQATGQGGLDPSNRPSIEVESASEMATQRQLSERNREVDSWLENSASESQSARSLPPNQHVVDRPDIDDESIPQREISLGNETENKPIPSQTYYIETGGGLTAEDVEIMRQNRNWADAPVLFNISQPDSAHYQPQTSQAAMEKYQRMCRDNDSIVSRAATWGTRRRSLPSIIDIDVQAAGNFLKKLSISRGEGRRPSILGGLRGLVRKPSTSMSKRARADNDDASSGGTDTSLDQREPQTKLAPPSPSPGWNRKNSVPSINTAFVAMGNSVAAIGATHARSGSISATPITSPKSPNTLNLSVKKPLMNRLRSKSENQAPGLVDMWKKSGGPPVSNLGNTKVNADADDDEDDEEDLEDGDMKSESNKLIDDITPNFAGFQHHVLKLNPQLSNGSNYLVERIAHQQIIRYKSLLNARVKHIQVTAHRNCPCGTMCIAQGGSAQILDSKNDMRGVDPLSAKFDGSDGDITPLEGAINQESFPQDIPMPPTGTLPAEFECQLCFTAKKFQKPSDWTKHVHEDVQPFTCTWERCRDPKIFKRKADWVRHENEGHRHLEWWKCDVEDCRHVCYRRDNFLQHLVREHKFSEPKVKTKAAIKRAGGNDPTWQKVEMCHEETQVQPQAEPCRFCGKTFPTWKKLTVHLAKHMEQISLPILKLVAKKELDEDTIISPVQDPPPRQFPATFPPPQSYDPSPTITQGPMLHQQGQMMFQNNQQQGQAWFPVVPQAYQPPLYNHNPQFEGMTHDMSPTAIGMPPVSHAVTGFTSINTQAYSGLPVTTSPYLTTLPTNYVSVTSDLEPFPGMSMNALGLQNHSPPAQMPYGGGGMLDMHAQEHAYTPQGSVSPYSRSPHQPQGAFYPPQ
ncbi:hypothetical protein QBC42DRAFT_32505 [Cladorrhinum samala]|uniref:C2H2-type domain-containing protein n=1 Tax=Cladorrhinum samala TaxID=585594 RepID=A0AAV9HVF9_9PEZI|nr:hypothetical protein QBC42DRAFT_32505 [Cladorrhinum samala]